MYYTCYFPRGGIIVPTLSNTVVPFFEKELGLLPRVIDLGYGDKGNQQRIARIHLKENSELGILSNQQDGKKIDAVILAEWYYADGKREAVSFSIIQEINKKNNSNSFLGNWNICSSKEFTKKQYRNKSGSLSAIGQPDDGSLYFKCGDGIYLEPHNGRKLVYIVKGFWFLDEKSKLTMNGDCFTLNARVITALVGNEIKVGEKEITDKWGNKLEKSVDFNKFAIW